MTSDAQPEHDDAAAATVVPAAAPPGRFRLKLRIDSAGLVHVDARGPAGSAAATTLLPDHTALSIASSTTDERDPWDDARRLGALLYELAFPPAVDLLLEESRYRADDSPLPIDLEVEGEQLAALPWELLFDPEGDRFLALAPRTPFTRSRPIDAAPAAARVATSGNLRALVLAPTLDERTLTTANAVGADSRVDVVAGTPTTRPKQTPHALHLIGMPWSDAPSASAPLVILDGCERAEMPTLPSSATVLLPGAMTSEERATFLRSFFSHLGEGSPVDVATVEARRTVAAEHGIATLGWSRPVLITTTPPAPLVVPERRVAILGARVKEHTIGWVLGTLSGLVTSLVLFLLSVLLYRLGFSKEEGGFELDILSPMSLYQSFSSLILELSSYQEYFLLAAAGLLATVSAVVIYLWLHNRVLDPEEQMGIAARLAGPLSSPRIVTIAVVATLTVLAAYGYQQYLWRIKLPIPDGKVGFAITRSAAASSFHDDLATALNGTGDDGDVVVRELPVQFDAGDTQDARDLGERIGARAVIIYRADDQAGQQSYVAHIVFTEPRIGLAVPGRQEAAAADPAIARDTMSIVVQIKEGAPVPTLRTSTLTELVNSAAGIIAFHEDRLQDAIVLLQGALPTDPSSANSGIVNFYLGNALQLDVQYGPAIAAYERAAHHYERLALLDPLGPRDELILVKTYLALGKLTSAAGDWTGAIGWYRKGVEHREPLLARADGLEQPSDVHATFARLYADLATAYRVVGDREEETFWDTRAKDEIAVLEAMTAPDDIVGQVQQSATRLATGDCVGAAAAVERALSLAPNDLDARFSAVAVAQFQGDSAAQTFGLDQPDDGQPGSLRAQAAIALLLATQAVNLDLGYVDPDALNAAETAFRAILSENPSSVAASQELAGLASWQGYSATTDLAARFSGDGWTAAKSQVLWIRDPVRRQAALDAFSTAIDHQMLAVELRHEDPGSALVLAELYGARLRVRAESLAFRTDEIGTAAFDDDGARILADADDVQAWTEGVLADGAGASRLDRLRAISLNIEARIAVSVWHELYAGDTAAAGAALSTMEPVVASAQALAATLTEPSASEAAALRTLYDQIWRFATVVADDPEMMADVNVRRAALEMSDSGAAAATGGLLSSVCAEERERRAGDALAAAGDDAGARLRYEAALAENPEHAPAFNALGELLFRQGDVDGAIATTTQGTNADGDLPALWRNLGRYHIVKGDVAARDAAYTRFFETLAPLSPEAQLASIRDGIAGLVDVTTRRPDLSQGTRDVVPRMTAHLDGMADPGDGFSYPGAYADLGRLALLADDAANAEALLRRSIELDDHQPLTHIDLALAVIARNGDATAEIEAAIAEATDELWQEAGISSLEILAAMASEIERYRQQFPERAAAVESFAEGVTRRQRAEEAAAATPNPATPVPIATPDASTPQAESYAATTYGFFVEAVGDWTITQATSDESGDYVQLSNDRSIIAIAAYAAEGGTPNDCIQAAIANLEGDPAVSDIVPMVGADGEPIRGRSADGLYVAFRYTFAFDDGSTGELVRYNECRLVPGQDAFLEVQHFALAETYLVEAPARDEVLATIVFSDTSAFQYDEEGGA